jgi:hypothetical protein
MASDAADIVPGFGYPAGALLFYSDKQSAAYNDERAAPPARGDAVDVLNAIERLKGW